LAAKEYLADDALPIFGNGMRFTKAEYIEAMPDIRLNGGAECRHQGLRVWQGGCCAAGFRSG
jgi:hypothetical protein